jgi:ComF family protein
MRCALPITGATVCGACLSDPPAFDATVVAADYLAPVDQLVLRLKYGGALELAPLFGNLLRDALIDSAVATLPTRLAPVPLGSARLIERGFNQALEIARPLARSTAIGLTAQLAVRQRDTGAQAGLTAPARRRNLRGAFIVPHRAAALVAGQHIGIVDDVMTTGATLHELAATLKRFGATRVTNLVFARTLPR